MNTKEMVSIIIFFFLFSNLIAETYYVSESSSTSEKTFNSIQTAINKAKAGDEIIIQKGRYHEVLNINKTVSIKGENLGAVFLVGKTGADSEIVCSSNDTEGGTIENIIFDPNDSKKEGVQSPILCIQNSKVTIRSCVFQNTCHSGAWVLGKKAIVTFEECTFENNDNGLYFYNGAEGIVTKCIFKNNKKSGLVIDGSASHINIQQSNFAGNSEDGLSITGGAFATIQECLFESNRKGVFGFHAKSVQLTGNKIFNNGIHGVHLFETNQSSLEKNICTKNGYSGIFIEEGGQSILTQNQCTENNQNGFGFIGKKLHIEVKENISKENQWQGIYAGPGVLGIIENNLFTANQFNGVMSENSDITIQKNECTGNGYSGICATLGSMGIISSNTCKQNRSYGIKVDDICSIPTLTENFCEENKLQNLYLEETPPLGRIREMLFNGQYDDLEKLLEDLHKTKKRNINGGWLAYQFYGSLSEQLGARSPENQEKYDIAVKKWIDLKPESITPRIILANSYVDRGWYHRGIGMANTVTQEGWEKLDKFLNMALVILDETEKLQEQDPELYRCYITVGMGLGRPREWVEEKFQRGISIQDNYHYLYTAMAEYLQPKWHGNKEDVRSFAEKAYQLTKQKEGKSIYARIVDNVYNCNDYEMFMSLEFPYEEIKSSHEDLLERYPQSYRNMNYLCLFACVYNDKETAQKLFPKIENNYHLDVWKNDGDYIKKAKEWAFSKSEE